ncbi:MAG: glycerol-3-phosphate acyltransferase [Chloroflexi bacterium]|nr:glycerol-3-phosphate acyltransferase [Anaerolineaceae bacterium]NMB87239.1 glycerol-3-phosphate acyltransferase [Chloroflexota bacterium]
MNPTMSVILVLVLSYLVGSIPNGLIVVKIASGKDIRQIESGRTGGTNAMRAAGFLAGLMTVLMDVGKGVAAGWIAEWLMPGAAWLKVVAAILAIIGHNYSIFLAESSDGRLRLRGGAGGATALGGAIALWPGSWMIILPIGVLVFLLIGYASVTTISIAFTSIFLFAYRAYLGLSPWLYVGYGVVALAVVLWALRPNLKRLQEGTERMVGLRAMLLKKARH